MTTIGRGMFLALGLLAGASGSLFAQGPGFYPPARQVYPSRGWYPGPGPAPGYDPYRERYFQGPQAAVVRELYTGYLRREPAYGELSHWTARPPGSLRWEMMRSLLSSDEYFNLQGGGVEGYLNALFRDVLGRPPTFREMDGWARAYYGSWDRQQFVAEFLSATRQDIGPRVGPFFP